MNSLLGSIIIGFLQGVLEWLPVSSEGNLVIILVSYFGLNTEETISTAIFLHIGTGFAALVYFKEKVIKILMGNSEEYADLRSKLIVMTGLTGIVGFPIFMWMNISVIYGELILALTGLALIITGLLQRNAGKRKQDKSKVSWSTSIILGAVQGLAIIPGLSRSGLTTSILLMKNFKGEEAFHISFLMSIPASFAAALGLMIVDGFNPDLYAMLSAGVSALIGYFTIDSMLKLSQRISFWKICIGLGTIAILAWVPSFLFG